MQADVIGSRKLSGALARTASAEFARIRKRRGRLTPAFVVDAAKSPNSPLHSCFTWDDRAAGRAHRLQQAAELIRSVRIVFRADPDDKPRTIRAQVSIVGPRGREYVPFVHAMTVEDYRGQLLSDALRDLEAFRAKYRDLSALAVVFAAIEKVAPRRRRAA